VKYEVVETRRVQQVLSADGPGQHRLPDRLFEREQHAGKRGHRQDMPHADCAGCREQAKNERHDHKSALIEKEKKAAIGPVDDCAAEGREKHAGYAETQPVETEVKGRISQLIDEPCLRRRLDERPGLA
jgi:hypothetical protein